MLSMNPSIINLVRLVVLGVVSFFAFIVLGVAGHIVAVDAIGGIVEVFATLGVAASVLTFFSVVPMIVVGMIRKGAFVNYIAVEIGWLGFLWILWTASAGLTTSQTSYLLPGCTAVFGVSGGATYSCSEPQVISAFGWLNFLLLLGYCGFLITMAAIQHSRGNQVWTKSVNEVDLFAPGTMPSGAHAPQQQQQPLMHAQQPMQQPPAPGTYPPTVGAGYVPTPPHQGNYGGPAPANYGGPAPVNYGGPAPINYGGPATANSGYPQV